ncbi:MAG: ABC transporter permease [Ginsengibacter sp.]
MIKNYFKIAWVNLARNKSVSFINIFGLALGMSLCLLIITIVKDQFSFDKFHPDADKIYRINTEAIRKNGSTEDYASSPYALAAFLRQNNSSTEKVVALANTLNGDAIANGKQLGVSGLMTNGTFLDVFGFTLLYGDKNTALNEPNTIVLTEKTAKKFFGNKNPLNRTLAFKGLSDFKITGVLKMPPGKTHFEFDALGSESTIPSLEKQEKIMLKTDDWKNYYMNYTYVKISGSDQKEALEKELAFLSKDQYKKLELESRDKGYKFYLQRLDKIVPGPMLSNNMGRGLPMPLLWVLITFAAIIIISAGFNYNSISLARSLSRAKEIGIRKATGAMRIQLIVQFLVEAILTALISLAVAIAFYEVVLKPGFQSLTIIQELDVSLNNDAGLFVLFFVFSIIVGLLSGIFPAMFLSKLNPVVALKDLGGKSVLPKLAFRKVLLVVQFSVALIFVVTLINLYRQTNFVINADYGFQKKNILNIDLQGNDYATVKHTIEGYNGVKKVSGVSHIMGTWRDMNVDVRIHPADDKVTVRDYSIDANYLSNLNLTLVAGKDFTVDLPADRELFAIVNENFLKKFHLGNPTEAIGKTIMVDDSTPLSISGVLKDFHFKPFTYNLEPLLLRYSPKDVAYLNVLINENDKKNTIAQLEKSWRSIDSKHDFSFSFFEDDIKNTYTQFEDIGKMIRVIALMAVVIACLGLLGLVIFSIKRQVKEIGIRKILGATVSQITFFVSRSFMKLLAIATLIGMPLSILLNGFLLNTFATRINPLAGYIAGFISLLFIACITIGFKIIRAAMANPVKSLRSE